MLNAATRERDADRKERQELTAAINVMASTHMAQAKATEELVKETRKGNVEAKQRNGHLGEQSIQIAEMVKSSTTSVLKAVQNIGIQHVGKQTVDEQIIGEAKK